MHYRWSWQLAAWLAYVVWTLCLMWPLLGHMTDRLPMGSEEVRTVPLFNQWTIGWNADRLAHGLHDYFDAPIFYPHRNTFAFSEPQPLTLLVAPIVWLSGSQTLAYNVYLMLSLVLNGWFTQLILRWLGCRWPVAIGAGLVMIALPILHWQLGVSQLVPLWGCLWTLWCVGKLTCSPTDNKITAQAAEHNESRNEHRETAWRGIELGLAASATFMMSVHHALFLGVLLVGCLVAIGPRWWHWRTVQALALAGLVAALVNAPVLLHLWQMSRVEKFTRPLETVDLLSLQLRDYGATFGNSPLSFLYATSDRYWRVSPGWSKLVWALVGVVAGYREPRLRSWTWLLTAFGLLAALMSLGTQIRLGTWQPWQTLIDYVPGFAQVRSPFRFAYFVQMACVLAAGVGVNAAWEWATRQRIERSSRPRLGSRFGCGVVITLGLLMLVDPLPYQLRMGVVPMIDDERDWLAVVRDYFDQADERVPADFGEIGLRETGLTETGLPAGAVLCLPMAGGNQVRDFEMTTEWMILAAEHHAPLVNGYSGFIPDDILDLGFETARVGLTANRVEKLYHQGLRLIVVDRSLFKFPWSHAETVGRLQVRQLIASRSGVDVYELGEAK